MVEKENAKRKEIEEKALEKARLKAENEEKSLSRVELILVEAWRSINASQHHQQIIKSLLKLVDEENFHKICVTEIQLIENGKLSCQKVEKFYYMWSKCLQKIWKLNQEFILLEEIQNNENISEEADDNNQLRTKLAIKSEVRECEQVYRRLLDLRKLSFVLFEAVVTWSEYLGYVHRHVDVAGKKAFEYIADDTGRAIVHDMSAEFRDACALQVLQEMNINDQDLFIILNKSSQDESNQAELYSFSELDIERITSW